MINSKKYDGVYHEGRKITDIKDMILSSTELYADHDAYLYKDKKAGRFVPIKYAQVRHDVEALGTKLIDMGLKGEKIAVMGETSYLWILTYFATVCGVGVIVPLDKNLPEGELRGLIARSGAAAIVYSDKMRKTVRPLLAGRYGEPEDLTDTAKQTGAGAQAASESKAEESNTAATSDAKATENSESKAADSKATATDAAADGHDLSKLRFFISMEDHSEFGDHEYDLHSLIREGSQLVEEGDRRYIDAVIDPDQVSTLLFTSGTTGMAKGVLLTHRNLTANVYEMSKFFKIPEPGIVLSVLPIHHVYEMTCDIMTTFYQGKTIAICEGIKYIQKDMVEVKANVMLGVPLVFEKMYKGMWKQAKRRGEAEKLRRAIDLSKRLKLYKNDSVVRKLFSAIHNSFGGNMKFFIAGGAAADPFIIEEFEAMGFPMLQGYGMSENAPIIAMNSDRYRKPDAAGQPLPGTTVKIVNQDEDGVGEIIVKGPSVMKGYYENEEATRETLRDGWLYTGDLGYIDEDNFVHITGRNKTVIVTKGGKNIFPEEVEDVLMKSDYVAEVIVHGVKDERVGNVMVTADIYPDYDLLKAEHPDMGQSEIYHFMRDIVDELNETMPPYKQVKRINIRKVPFIKTTSGKIRRYGNDLVDTSAGELDWNELKHLEDKKAKEVVKSVAQSQDPALANKTLTPVTDIRSLINASEQAYSDNTAFVQNFEGENIDGDSTVEVTYKHAMADIEGLGTALMNRDISDRRVAIMGAASYEWQISFLAVTAGVGVAVPIDTEVSDDELARRLNEAEVTVAFTENRYLDRFTRLNAEGKIHLDILVDFESSDELSESMNSGDDDTAKQSSAAGSAPAAADSAQVEALKPLSWHALVKEGKMQVSQGDRQFLDKETLGTDTAAIFYTSGATGQNKGVELTAGSIVYDVMMMEAAIGFTKEDVVYSMIPMHNMYEITCGLLLPIYAGAAVASAAGTVKTARDLQIELCNVRPTVFIGIPDAIEDVKNNIVSNLTARDDMGMKAVMGINRLTKKIGMNLMGQYTKDILKNLGGRLRLVIAGGAPSDSATLRTINEAGITCVEGYGLTECSPVVAVNPPFENHMRAGSCGKVLPGVEVKIIKDNPSGTGEICVRGANLAKGYYKDQALTDKFFVDGWFKTGDIGRLDDDNYVYITGGRKDDRN
ncbi:MAG: AMP-binding protein [Eubacteriales bacterium]|nr:AMP-binding protein [Eubacteriales bacterium]